MSDQTNTAVRPRIAIFDFTSCEGCQLQIINLEEELVPLVGLVEIVEFREAMSERSDEYDIAIVEGSITRKSEIPRIESIRERAKILIALGACAHLGGINALKNRFSMTRVRREVYGDSDQGADTIPTRPLSAVVHVDYAIPGCPIDKDEFLRVVSMILLGRRVVLTDNPVCTECKLRENVCRFDLGEVCLGPIIRGGCKAICPSYGHPCDGCRGFVNEPNLNAHTEVLRSHGVTAAELMQHFTLFTECQVEANGAGKLRRKVAADE